MSLKSRNLSDFGDWPMSSDSGDFARVGGLQDSPVTLVFTIGLSFDGKFYFSHKRSPETCVFTIEVSLDGSFCIFILLRWVNKKAGIFWIPASLL